MFIVISLAYQTAILSVRPEWGSGYRAVLPPTLSALNKAAYSGIVVTGLPYIPPLLK